MLDQQRLKELLRYEPDTGRFFWLRGPGFRRDLDGAEAGCSSGDRIQIMIDGKNYRPHRLAWLYMTGALPEGDLEIDHRDGDQHNNRWTNLRKVTRQVNQQNLRKAHRDSATGLLGVTKRDGRFMAVIYADRKRHFLGTFASPEAAHAAYVQAKRQLHEGNTL